MKTLLIYGLETVAGANLAAALADQYHVLGVSQQDLPELTGCQLITGQSASWPPDKLLSHLHPQLVLDTSCCGDSSWNPQAQLGTAAQCQLSLERAQACQKLQIPFSLLSSDAVFAGPWMFHEEESTAFSSEETAARLRQLEIDVQKAAAHALIIRTHLFGWNRLKNPAQTGWIEDLLHKMETAQPCREVKQPGHATPILASMLAPVLDQALEAGLTGLYHIAGAERVNRLQFTHQLAKVMGIKAFKIPVLEAHYTQAERNGFACGETSLQTRAIRRELELSMPTLAESLAQLLQERPQQNGHFTSSAPLSLELAQAA